MNDCDGQKAFSLLWSMTDKIFDNVADIRNLLNTTCVPAAGRLPDDPPSYESSTSEHFTEQLREKFDCLDDLNKQRKLLYEQYAHKENQRDQLESVHSEEKQQVPDKEGGSTHPAAPTPRVVAIKTLRWFLRNRPTALTTNCKRLVQIRQGLSALPARCFETDKSGCSTWYPEEQKKFYAELKLLQLFISQTGKDRSSLLRNGKMLKEKILGVPHDTGEETSKLMESVQDSYRQAEEIVLPNFLDLLLPFFANLPNCVKDNELKAVLSSVVDSIDNFYDRYLDTVAAYQGALQDLADLLVP